MTLSAEDRLAIAELISLHGHLFDDGRLDELAELFAEDVVYDVSAFGQGSWWGSERSGTRPSRSAPRTPSPITSPTS